MERRWRYAHSRAGPPTARGRRTRDRTLRPPTTPPRWRRRYFRLVDNKLFFYKTQGDEPHGVIDLTLCLTVKSAEEKTGKPHSLEVATPDETFYMYADSEAEKDAWIGAIGRSIVRFSASYRPAVGMADDDDDDDIE